MVVMIFSRIFGICKWSIPKFGSHVNTSANEISPFIMSDGLTLFLVAICLLIEMILIYSILLLGMMVR